MQETRVAILGWEESPEKEMATHSSILYLWEIYGKSHKQRSLVGYGPWGHERVGHNLATKIHTCFKGNFLERNCELKYNCFAPSE